MKAKRRDGEDSSESRTNCCGCCVRYSSWKDVRGNGESRASPFLKHRNSGRLKRCVVTELENEEKKKEEWEKKVSDLVKHQAAAEAATAAACKKFRKLSENRASAERF